MKLPHILTNNSLTIIVDGKALTMESSNPSFNEATKLLSEERFDELPDLFDVPKAVEKFADGNISVSDGEVRYKGEAIHNHVVGRVLDFMRQGLPYKPLVRFLDKLMENPSRRAVGGVCNRNTWLRLEASFSIVLCSDIIPCHHRASSGADFCAQTPL